MGSAASSSYFSHLERETLRRYVQTWLPAQKLAPVGQAQPDEG